MKNKNDMKNKNNNKNNIKNKNKNKNKDKNKDKKKDKKNKKNNNKKKKKKKKNTKKKKTINKNNNKNSNKKKIKLITGKIRRGKTITDVKIEVGSGGKGGGSGQRNNFLSKKYTYASNTNSHKSEIDELKTATYIVSQVSLADQYEKVTKAIYWFVIQKIPAGVELTRGMRDSMLPRFPLSTKTKKEPGVDIKEYEIISY